MITGNGWIMDGGGGEKRSRDNEKEVLSIQVTSRYFVHEKCCYDIVRVMWF